MKKRATKKDTKKYIAEHIGLDTAQCCRTCVNFRSIELGEQGTCKIVRTYASRDYIGWRGGYRAVKTVLNLRVPPHGICDFHTPSRRSAVKAFTSHEYNDEVLPLTEENKERIDKLMVERMDPRDVVKARLKNRKE